MLNYGLIDGKRGGIHLPQINNSKKFMVCHNCFLVMVLNFMILSVMVVRMFCLKLSDTAIITVKNFDCSCIFHEARNLMHFNRQKILCLMIVCLYKMHINEIIIKNMVYSFGNLINLIKTKI